MIGVYKIYRANERGKQRSPAIRLAVRRRQAILILPMGETFLIPFSDKPSVLARNLDRHSRLSNQADGGLGYSPAVEHVLRWDLYAAWNAEASGGRKTRNQFLAEQLLSATFVADPSEVDAVYAQHRHNCDLETNGKKYAHAAASRLRRGRDATGERVALAMDLYRVPMISWTRMALVAMPSVSWASITCPETAPRVRLALLQLAYKLKCYAVVEEFDRVLDEAKEKFVWNHAIPGWQYHMILLRQGIPVHDRLRMYLRGRATRGVCLDDTSLPTGNYLAVGKLRQNRYYKSSVVALLQAGADPATAQASFMQLIPTLPDYNSNDVAVARAKRAFWLPDEMRHVDMAGV